VPRVRIPRSMSPIPPNRYFYYYEDLIVYLTVIFFFFFVQIKDKINKHAFSGGGATLEEQREKGANLAVDVSCEYLSFFLEDDERLQQIYSDYSTGKMLTGEVKKELIDIIQVMVVEHAERKAQVTPEVIADFMRVRPLEF
jgi:tryptophanyl-tRNA synthetase